MPGVRKHGWWTLVAVFALALFACASESGNPTTSTEPPPTTTAAPLSSTSGTTTTTTPTTTWTLRGDTPVGKIAFVSDREGNDDIYVMNADGSEVERLTDDPADDFQPQWFDGGTRIAFRSDRIAVDDPLGDLAGAGVFAMDADGLNVTRFPGEVRNVVDFAVTPDGSLLATETVNGLFVFDAATGDELARLGGSVPQWSADGRALLFERPRDAFVNLAIWDSEAREVTAVTDHDGLDWSAAWSPDGSTIVFESCCEESVELYAISPDGTGQRRFTGEVAPPDLAERPLWSPTGDRIALHVGVASEWDMHVFDADGNNPTRVTEDAGTEVPRSWSPDGHWIAYSKGPLGRGEIYVVSVDGAVQLRLTTNDAADHSPTWHPGP